MTRRLSPVGLEFVDAAPVRLTFTTTLSAAPPTVYRALAEDVAGWSRWFKAVVSCAPTEGGKGREVRLTGGVRFSETVMAATPHTHYAYRVDTTNTPGPRALLEDWSLFPADPGTQVRWTFTADGPVPFRAAMRLARPGLARAFRDSMRALERRLAAG